MRSMRATPFAEPFSLSNWLQTMFGRRHAAPQASDEYTLREAKSLMLDLIEDCDSPRKTHVFARVRVAQNLAELRNLHADLFNVIALARGERVARARMHAMGHEMATAPSDTRPGNL